MAGRPKKERPWGEVKNLSTRDVDPKHIKTLETLGLIFDKTQGEVINEIFEKFMPVFIEESGIYSGVT